MPVAQCRGAEALIRLRIAGIADPDAAEIEQADDGCDHCVLTERTARKIIGDAGAYAGQGCTEIEAAVIFLGLLPRAEIGVVAILLPTLFIIADRLDMTLGRGAEPGVTIGGRQCDPVQPVDLVAVLDAISLGIKIGPAS